MSLQVILDLPGQLVSWIWTHLLAKSFQTLNQSADLRLYGTSSEASDQKDQGDATDSKQVSANRRKLIEHIKEKRDSKLTKSKSAAPSCH